MPGALHLKPCFLHAFLHFFCGIELTIAVQVKKREHYVSPSLKRKQKSEAARKNKRKFY